MNRTWASSIENLWHSQSLPMWLTIAAAGFFAVVLLVTLFRAERSVANGALTVITLLAIGIAVTTMLRGSGGGASADLKSTPVSAGPSLPALACLDGLAGESVEAACEKALFASADTAAAGVSYTAAQVSRLAAFGSAVNANKAMTPELNALRRTIERDRYGLVAQVLKTREGCTLSAACPFFQSLTNSAQISSNMSENLYDNLIERYAASWNAPVAVGTAAVPAAASTAAAAVGTVPPPGRPVSGDFPSAASIPPINIMTPEPAAQGSQAAQRPAAEPAPRGAPGAVINPQPAPTAAKKAAPTQHKSRAQAPVQLAPPTQSDDN